ARHRRIRRGAGHDPRASRRKPPVSAPGDPRAARLGRIGTELGERELDALLVTAAPDLRYVTGFRGDQGEGAAIVMARDGASEGAAAHLFLTDFRYETQSEQEVAPEFE